MQLELNLHPKKRKQIACLEAKPYLASYVLDFSREASDFIPISMRPDQINPEKMLVDANTEAYQRTRVFLTKSISLELRVE
jgi:hypothetical protein